MILPDTNLLIYAFRREYPQHEPTRRWLEGLWVAGEKVLVHPLTGTAFLRLTTRPLGPVPPAPMEDAVAFLSAIDRAGGPFPRAEASTHGTVLARLCSRHGIRGDGVVDAWLAAFCITHRIRFASHDGGFARFSPELQWVDPLADD